MLGSLLMLVERKITTTKIATNMVFPSNSLETLLKPFNYTLLTESMWYNDNNQCVTNKIRKIRTHKSRAHAKYFAVTINIIENRVWKEIIMQVTRKYSFGSNIMNTFKFTQKITHHKIQKTILIIFFCFFLYYSQSKKKKTPSERFFIRIKVSEN